MMWIHLGDETSLVSYLLINCETLTFVSTVHLTLFIENITTYPGQMFL